MNTEKEKEEYQDVEESEVNERETPEVQQEFSKVAVSRKQSLLVFGVIGVIVAYILFTFFIKSQGSDNETSKPKAVNLKDVTNPVSKDSVDDSPSIPQLPELPKLVTPKAPPPPPPPPTPPAIKIAEPDSKMLEEKDLPSMPDPLPVKADFKAPKLPPIPAVPIINDPGLPSNDKSDAEEKRKEAKRKSNMILIAGVPQVKTQEELQQEQDFIKRGDMSLTLARGKIIDAILETAINTDFGGEIRAVISRDVYAESNKNILIPKGSKVFGKYESSISGVYGRVFIQWFRIDLINGYSVNLQTSDGIDNLGRKGNQGRVDNKYKEKLSNIVLLSAFNLAVAEGLDKLVPPVDSNNATANKATATNIQNIVTTVSADSTTPNEDDKVNAICTQSRNAITDKGSSLYQSIDQACNNARVAQPGQKLSMLTSSINTAVSASLVSNSTTTSPTQAQTASKQAFTDITDTVKDMITAYDFKPTITINQGELVKIYVNKDYNFPKKVITKTRLVK